MKPHDGAKGATRLNADHTSNHAAAAAPAKLVVQLLPNTQVPTLDFERVPLGNSRALALTLENPALSDQTLRLTECPTSRGFEVTGLATGHELLLPARSQALVAVVWKPTSIGPVSCSITLLLQDQTKIVLRLLGTALAPRATPAAAVHPNIAGTERLSQTARSNGERPRTQSQDMPPPAAPSLQSARPTNKATARPPLSRRESLTGAPQPAPHSARPDITGSLSARSFQSVSSNHSIAPKSTHGAAPPPSRLRLKRNDDPPSPTHSSAGSIASSRRSQMTTGTNRSAVTSRLDSRDEPASAALKNTFGYYHKQLWVEKQERAFTAWLNDVLAPYTPDVMRMRLEDEQAETLASLKLIAQVRGLLWRQYTRNEDLIEAMLKVEKRIEEGRLRIKDEEGLLGDVHLRDHAVKVLTSYHPFWLRLGLETVVRRAVSAEAGSLRSLLAAAGNGADGLAVFVKEQFLRDPEMEASFASRGVAASDKARYWAELGKLVLKRVLLLVALLDVTAQLPGLPPGVPLLFHVDSGVKSSAQVVQEVLSGLLVGEGNLLRHLELAGYRLRYKQDPLQEYPYTVTNLAKDLRDGVRLCRLTEALTGVDTVMAAVRVPCERRPMQVHNTELALKALAEAHVTLEVSKAKRVVPVRAEDLVDGNQDITLALLWHIITGLQLPKLVDGAVLRVELQRIAQRQSAAAGGARKLAPSLAALPASGKGEHGALLMQWVQAVAASYGVPVVNFTTSFADGRVLCLLICYYLPGYLQEEQIYVPAVINPEEAAVLDICGDQDHNTEAMAALHGWCGLYGAGGCVDDGAVQQHRHGVAQNFAAVHTAARALGGIPQMLSSDDFSEHGPDEKAVLLYCAFLCRRLLEVSYEDRAAHIIQAAWFKYKMYRKGGARAHLARWVRAATFVQRAVRAWLFRRAFIRLRDAQQRSLGAVTRLQAAWRTRAVRLSFLRQRASARCIQRHWRSYWKHKQAVQRRVALKTAAARLSAATLIQAAWRSLQQRRTEAMARTVDGVLLRWHQLVEERRQAKLVRWAPRLQAMWRGSRQRNAFQVQRNAASKVQAAWRGCQQRERYLGMRGAAVLIQRTYRRYLRQSRAAVVLQSAWRGRQARQMLWTLKSCVPAVAVIQRAFRTWQARKKFLEVRQAAVQIQAQWRAHVAQRDYRSMWAAAVYLQAHARGYLARLHLKRLRAAAVAIQAAWRGACIRRQLKRERAARTIQRCARGWSVRAHLRQQHAAAVQLQSAWRMRSAVRQRQRCTRAAVLIQTAWRCRHATQRYKAQRGAALLCQTAWRCRLARRLLQHMRAARTIQRVYRGYTVRQGMRRQHAAAVALQAAWKSHAQRQRYLWVLGCVVRLQAAIRCKLALSRFRRLRAAAVKLQSSWRCVRARRQLVALRAAVCIQRVWRGYRVRRQLRLERSSAVVIQSVWRGRTQRRHFLAVRRTTLMLQSMVRMRLAKRRFTGARSAVVCIQKHWRASLARGHWQRCRHAVLLLQASWRSCRQRRRYLAMRQAACIFQAVCRGWLARSRMQRLRSAAVVFQSAWRAVQARRCLHRHRSARLIQSNWRRHTAQRGLQQHRQAAVVVQAAWRCHVQRRRYRSMQNAAMVIQAACRGWLARRNLRSKRSACVMIQSAWRAHTARRLLHRHKAARLVQSHWRRYQARTSFQASRAAAVRIQAQVRGFQARSSYQAARRAATSIQTAVRGSLCRRRYRAVAAAALLLQSACRARAARMALRRQRAAATIQRVYRGYCVRRWLLSQHLAAVRIQAAWRGWAGRRRYLRQREAVICIQASLRRWIARRAFFNALGCVVHIQRFWRRRQARIHRRKEAAAVVLQACCRGMLARRLYCRMTAATTIQRHVRGWLQRTHYAALRQAALVLQCRIRCQAAVEQMRSQMAMQNALLQLQATALQYVQRSAGALKLQAWWRGEMVRKTFRPVWRAHKESKQMLWAAVTIQRYWRGSVGRRHAARRRAAAITIGQHAQLFIDRCRYLRERRSVLAVKLAAQHAEARRAAAARTIQRCWRARKEQRNHAVLVAAVTRVQALWRGRRVRQAQRQRRELAEARKRIAAAAAAAQAAPHKQLGARARDALQVLLSSNQLVQASMALSAIELATRYSPACCRLIVDSQGITALLNFMRSCNRMPQSIEMLIRILAVLTNICRHTELLPTVAAAGSCIAVLSERLQFFRDQEDVFMPTLALLRRLLSCQQVAARVGSMPMVMKQWDAIAQLLSRKIDMEKKYLDRLEGEKGSDVAAREATRKVLAASKQLEGLQSVIQAAVSAAPGMLSPARPTPDAAGARDQTAAVVSSWHPKNTLVRDTFRQIERQNHGRTSQELPAAATPRTARQ